MKANKYEFLVDLLFGICDSDSSRVDLIDSAESQGVAPSSTLRIRLPKRE